MHRPRLSRLEQFGRDPCVSRRRDTWRALSNSSDRQDVCGPYRCGELLGTVGAEHVRLGRHRQGLRLDAMPSTRRLGVHWRHAGHSGAVYQYRQFDCQTSCRPQARLLGLQNQHFRCSCGAPSVRGATVCIYARNPQPMRLAMPTASVAAQ